MMGTSKIFTQDSLLGLSISGKAADSKPLIFPRHIADAVRSITKPRFNDKQNRALLVFIRRGFQAQQGNLNDMLIEGVENITAERLGNIVCDLCSIVEAFPKDRPRTQDEAKTIDALASASTAVAFLAKNRRKIKPSIHEPVDQNAPSPSIPQDEL